MVVTPWKSEPRKIAWTASSVSRSMLLVASSRTRILVLRKSALAKQTNCRCPELKSASQLNRLARRV
jgi:hypothetical protein